MRQSSSYKGIRFSPGGLTIVFGENGSGKTGFTRLFRKACRTRVEKTVDLAILNNVYGQTDGAAEATFLFHDGSNEIEVPWADTGGNDDRLSAISVFDTKSAQLYVDEGNKLRFLPADLDLPFRLNDLIKTVEDRIAPASEKNDAILGHWAILSHLLAWILERAPFTGT